jgi:hypothetical protein
MFKIPDSLLAFSRSLNNDDGCSMLKLAALAPIEAGILAAQRRDKGAKRE